LIRPRVSFKSWTFALDSYF